MSRSLVAQLYNTFQWAWQSETDYDIEPTKLFLHIEALEWPESMRRARSYPQEVTTWVRRVDEFQGQIWRILPIHAALVSQAPAEVIDTLLELFPGSIKERDDQNNLPIHLVCNNYRPNDEVICALLESDPLSIEENNPNNGLSLKDYERNCTRIYQLLQKKEWNKVINRSKLYGNEVKTWVVRRDCGKIRWRMLPIHAAVLFSAPVEVIRALLKSFPEGSRCVDDEFLLPIHRELKKPRYNDETVEILYRAMLFPRKLFLYTEGTTERHMLTDYDVDCTQLYKLIKKKEWNIVISRITTNPEEVQTWVMKKQMNGGLQFRHLPLHFALEQNAPFPIIEALLTGYLDAVRCRDEQGRFPLQIALQNFSPQSDVTKILIKAVDKPEDISMKDSKGNVIMCIYDRNPPELYTLIEACQWQKCIHRATMFPEEAQTWVMRKQPHGTLRWRLLPIHAAIIFKAPSDVISTLLFAYSEGAKCRDDQGMLPYHLAKWKRSPDDVVEMIKLTFPDAVHMKDPKGRIKLNHSETIKRKTIDVNEAGSDESNNNSDDENRPTPTIICDYDRNPPRLFKLIESNQWNEVVAHLGKEPHEAAAWTRRRNPNGSVKWRLLPLHAAVIFKAPCIVVKALLLAYREGASCHDDKGMLPLHLATWQRTTKNTDVIEELIKAYPEGTQVKDLKGRIPGDMFKYSTVDS